MSATLAMIFEKKKETVLMTHPLPHPFCDIRKQIPNQEFRVIFDVGANEGQSCLPYAQAFPDATVFAFEPVSETFEALKNKTLPYKNIKPHEIAFGEVDGILSMKVSGTSSMNRVVPEGTAGAAAKVKTARIDTFCYEQKIPYINFLKIDTEGYDQNVLRGCGDYLRNIDFIQCEASANDYNKFHNNFAKLSEFMSAAGFFLYYVYGQTFEWGGGGYPVLRRFDPVFINQRVVGPLKNVIVA